MSPKGIILCALLSVAFAERPYLGFSMPSLDEVLPHVVGGKEAAKGSFPFIVSLQWGTNSKTTRHFCAGSILNKRWILTAGHCVRAVPSSGIFLIKAGKHNIKNNEPTEQKIEVLKSIVHENYDNGVGPYDFGLLQLKAPLTFTKEVQPIELPREKSEPEGDVVLCGWGSTSQSWIPSMPDNLQYVDMKIVDRKTCHDSVMRLVGHSPVHETNVCTGPLSGGISACSGDSGGPLIKRYGNKSVGVGVVSWGIIPCGTVGAPSVYGKISVFITWIQAIIKANQE